MFIVINQLKFNLQNKYFKINYPKLTKRLRKFNTEYYSTGYRADLLHIIVDKSIKTHPDEKPFNAAIQRHRWISYHEENTELIIFFLEY